MDAIRALSGELLPLSNNDGAVFLEPDWDGIPDFAEVKGQAAAKRALEIAAAGGHNVIFICGEFHAWFYLLGELDLPVVEAVVAGMA